MARVHELRLMARVARLYHERGLSQSAIAGQRSCDVLRSREAGGPGLGLTIARQMTDLHGARLDVESELGRGSVFTDRSGPGPGARVATGESVRWIQPVSQARPEVFAPTIRDRGLLGAIVPV